LEQPFKVLIKQSSNFEDYPTSFNIEVNLLISNGSLDTFRIKVNIYPMRSFGIDFSSICYQVMEDYFTLIEI